MYNAFTNVSQIIWIVYFAIRTEE